MHRDRLANAVDAAARARSTGRVIDTEVLGAELWHVVADERPGEFAPITQLRVVDAEPFPAMVVIDIGMTEHKARTLARWSQLYDVLDVVAGKFHRSDSVLRLNVRGVAGHTPVCVVCPFDETADRELARLINSSINVAPPRRLIDHLARAEGRAER